MAKILVVFAHSQFQNSRVNRVMIETINNLEHIKIHDLYEMYPDFHINIPQEKVALLDAHTLVLQHPFQWYSCPSLMKEWLDEVLQKGWAYGEGGNALKGKRMLNVITTGGAQEAYQEYGYNRFTINQFLVPFKQTAYLCGMEYLEPLVLHDALRVNEATIQDHSKKYKNLLTSLVETNL